jgi:hypothetical protein
MNANKRSELLDIELEINTKDSSSLINKDIHNDNNNIILTPLTKSISLNPYFQNKFTKAEIFDFKSLNDTSKILYTKEPNNNINPNEEATKQIPSSFEQFNNFFHFKTDIPFKDDINKISRFAKYVAEKEGLIVDTSYGSNVNLMSIEQLKIENKQFSTLYNEHCRIKKNEELKKVELKSSGPGPGSGSVSEGISLSINSESDKLKEKIENIKNTEIKAEISVWKPNTIICKRFKIKDPFENKINIIQSNNNEINESISFRKGDNNYSMSSLQYQLFKQETSKFSNNNKNISNNDNKPIESILNKPIEPINTNINISNINNDIKISNNKKNVFEAMNTKIDMNLFDEIFGE